MADRFIQKPASIPEHMRRINDWWRLVGQALIPSHCANSILFFIVNKMKRIVIYIVALYCLSFSLTSRAQDLSAEGKGHFIAAQRLFEIATSVDDYKLIAEEFESVAKSDPSFANTYINLCVVYSRIGAGQGEPYFSKAEAALETYKKLAPEDTAGYTEEKIALQAMRRKYDSNYQSIVKKKFVGTWRDKVHKGINYIFRISESGDFLDVRVFTWRTEKELETYDVSLNGGTLSFTVKNIDIDYVNGSPLRKTTEFGGKTIIYDKTVSYDHWKLTFSGEQIIATNKWEEYYYLNGRYVYERGNQYSDSYVKD